MTNRSKEQAIIALSAIAAAAAKLADDLKGGRLWEGDYNKGLEQISRYVRDLPADHSLC